MKLSIEQIYESCMKLSTEHRAMYGPRMKFIIQGYCYGPSLKGLTDLQALQE